MNERPLPSGPREKGLEIACSAALQNISLRLKQRNQPQQTPTQPLPQIRVAPKPQCEAILSPAEAQPEARRETGEKTAGESWPVLSLEPKLMPISSSQEKQIKPPPEPPQISVVPRNTMGPIQELLDDPGVEEIWINGPEQIFVARNGCSQQLELQLSSGQIRDLVERMLQGTGRRVDLSNPFVDASLPDGSRLHVVIPDITRQNISVNIRKFNRKIRSLEELVRRGSLSPSAADFLRASVAAACNILVSGATQAGKTTMLNSLLACCRAQERVVTVEETFELDVPRPDVVGMQCRQPSLEGKGEVNLRRLIKEALRMRPDRLVVGEVREAESLDLLIALNSGLPGAGTIHANSARDALTKICTLPLLAGRNIDASFVVPTVASCIDLIVHCELDVTGRRHVEEILALSGRTHEGVIEASSIFLRPPGERPLSFTGVLPERQDNFIRAGIELRHLLPAPDPEAAI